MPPKTKKPLFGLAKSRHEDFLARQKVAIVADDEIMDITKDGPTDNSTESRVEFVTKNFLERRKGIENMEYDASDGGDLITYLAGR